MIKLYLVMAGVIWGFNVVVVKMNSTFFHPLFLICLKLIISTLSLAIYLSIKHHHIIQYPMKDIIIDSHLVNVFNFICTYFAIFLLSGCTSATLNCLSPIIMTLYVFAFDHKMTKRDFILLVLGAFGFLMTIAFQIRQLSIGHYLMLLGIALYNGGHYLIKKRNIQDVLGYNFYLLFLSMIEMIVICFVLKEEMIKGPVDTLSLWLLVITSGLGYAYIQSVSFLAIQQMGAIKTSFFLSLSPIFTCLFSMLFLKESMNLYEMIGFLIIIYTLFLKNYFSSKQ